MLKFVYVLTTDQKDLYTEQAYLSIYSLKLKMPEAYTILLVDDLTESYLRRNKQYILSIISELKVIKIDPIFNKKQRSRFLKTTMREYISGNFLYIDCDTIITDNLSDINQTQADIAGILDTHVPLSKYYAKKRVTSMHIEMGMTEALNNDSHFNGGIMFARDTEAAHHYFMTWHNLWLECVKKGVNIDQIALNEANARCGDIIQELNGIWNCQILKGGISYLADAKIIHYFATQDYNPHPFYLADESILNEISQTGMIPTAVYPYLENPKKAFNLQTKLFADTEMLDFIESRLFADIIKLARKKPILYKKLLNIDKFVHSLGLRKKLRK